MQYTAGNISFHVEEQGTGEPALLFLHYWGGTSRTWTNVITALKDRFRCIAYDQRGWGHSDKPSTGYDLTSLADDAANLVTALGLRNYILVGTPWAARSHSSSHRAAPLVSLD